MSCQTWKALLSEGERLLWEGSPERLAAEVHFQSCRSCAERAFLLDPSWAVRRDRDSGSPAGSSPDRREMAELEQAILANGRIREFEGSVRNLGAPIRVAAAAAVVVALLGAGVLIGTKADLRSSLDAGLPERSAVSIPASAAVPSRAAAARLSLPSVGSLAPSAARVYDLGQEDFALVMVVHETLDL